MATIVKRINGAELVKKNLTLTLKVKGVRALTLRLRFALYIFKWLSPIDVICEYDLNKTQEGEGG